jgi:hypothetical protein
MNCRHLGFWTVLVLSCTVLNTQASVLVPDGLQPGDMYHLAFVTRGERNATSTDIQDYNDFVQLQASANAALTGTDMGVTWRAIASTSATDARDNARVEAPVYLMNGTTQIASGFADMWDGSLLAPIGLDQFANPISTIVWTGSSTDGFATGQPLGSPDFRTAGATTQSDGRWISQGIAGESIQTLYALSTKLTVPGTAAVPEPAMYAVWLVLGSLGGLTYARHGRLTSGASS